MKGFTNSPQTLRAYPEMKKVSEPTIGRLSVYLRLLMELSESGIATVSSETMAAQSGTTAAQVRKDLSLFGTFGKRGLGYSVEKLQRQLREILGLERKWGVALVGAGRIGAALFGYENFRRQGFYIEAVFDSDADRVGQRWNGVIVEPDTTMERVVMERGLEIAVLAVPARSAQRVAERLIGTGIRGILNFAPVRLDVPPEIVVKSVDMAVEMEGLSYALTHGGENVGSR